MKKKEGIMKCEVFMSDNEKYRYQLTRTWDDTKDNATIIMLNPSKAELFITDKTVMNVQNFLIKNNYGSMTIVNIFSYMTTNPSYLKEREEVFESENDKFIYKACKDAELIIVAWTRDKHTRRKREIENLIYPFNKKVMCFQDEKGLKPRHPRDLNDKTWTLDSYPFPLYEED
ncbi:TPA: DUF1643 domain-containing protein [Bacillus cereus]|nr:MULTISPECIES: DUF1643 domain-containing protein [Bacillus]MCP1177725.1 DUF1643 domain-containing protein [Bacillus sp. 1663tsa1]MCP1284730.1 DUF1643 domain-containing protein [Bacillus sp. S0635]MCQ6348536.1 DUF1643 domain-containing protein [Bacillus cereus]MCU5750346.1 DUF1643 domain-containing protein [Bacillus cereus]HDX9630586.1 DUF1643 domain-containing protein [Bacillus cereus]